MHAETNSITEPYPRRDLIRGAEVHVWRFSLKQAPEVLSALSQTLAPEESERAARFHFRKDRDSFVVARGVLRDILGRYLGVRPGQVRFTYGEYGKPALAGATCGGLALRFNLSHSHEAACCAVACGREVGVDVEYLKSGVETLSLAEHFFSRGEVAALKALPPDQQLRGFFHCWTRKEAYIKARGEGLSHPLDAFDVSLAPGEPAALLGTRGDPQELTRWTLHALDAGTDYAAAVAIHGTNYTLRLWQWPPPGLNS